MDPRKIEHIISAAPAEAGIYMVLTTYWETDALGAVGQVISNSWARGALVNTVLNTTDPLGALWSSSANHLWVGSANGDVWTTAPVSWPPHRTQSLSFDILDPALNWRVTTLPDLKTRNHVPNVTAIWGSSDADVYAATFQGAIYHWDGTAWQEMPTGIQTGLNHIHGTAKDNVYCVGEQGVVLHCDGGRWRRIPYPGDAGNSDGLTGVRAVSSKEVFICGRAGAILHGSPHGLEVLTTCRTSFYGIAYFQNRLILAGGDSGAWELKGNQASQIKDNFAAVGVFEARNILLFVEPSQEPKPRIVEYDPVHPMPWTRRAF